MYAEQEWLSSEAQIDHRPFIIHHRVLHPNGNRSVVDVRHGSRLALTDGQQFLLAVILQVCVGLLDELHAVLLAHFGLVVGALGAEHRDFKDGAGPDDGVHYVQVALHVEEELSVGLDVV